MNKQALEYIRLLHEQSKRNVVGGSPCPCGKYGDQCRSWVNSQGRVICPLMPGWEPGDDRMLA